MLARLSASAVWRAAEPRMAAVSAVWAESKRSTGRTFPRPPSGLLERRRVCAQRPAAAVDAVQARGHLVGRLLEQRGELHLERMRLRERLAVHGVEDLGRQLGEQDVAALLEGGDLVGAPGGDEAELLLGQGDQLVRGAHAAAAPAATCAHASRS